MNPVLNSVRGPLPVQGGEPRRPTPRLPEGARTFDSVLADANVQISGHAQARMARRGLAVGPDGAAKLASAIDRAAAKGSRRSLVFLDELALLVSVPERVVVTAMSADAMRDGVVTQIDSAVVA